MPSYCLKVCGLTRAEDALMCAELGVDWLGFIFHPASLRRVEPGPVAGFETGAARRVGVFVDQTPAEVNLIMAQARLDLAQLHGDQSREFCQAVGPERVIKVLWPQRGAGPEDLSREMAGFSEAAAFFLLEAGTTGGGHGRPLDLGRWASLAPSRPWLLAGGLEAASVRTLAARPPAGLIGFDFNSRVESAPGLKDRRLVAAAVEAVRKNEV
jgi:phosphoribosylanthranilate isomerase